MMAMRQGSVTAYRIANNVKKESELLTSLTGAGLMTFQI